MPNKTPFFAMLLLFYLLGHFQHGIIGVMYGFVYTIILAFFTPFVPKWHIATLLGLEFARVTYNLAYAIPLVVSILPDTAPLFFTPFGVFVLWFNTMFSILFSYLLAFYSLKRHKIRERVGKCFH